MLALPPHKYTYDEIRKMVDEVFSKQEEKLTMKIVMNSRDFYINDFKGLFVIKTKEGQLQFNKWVDDFLNETPDFLKLPVQP